MNNDASHAETCSQNPDAAALANLANLENLRISEIRYRRLFEMARDGILILDAVTRKIIDVNPFMMELLGFTREEFLDKELFQIGLLKDEQASLAAFKELQENGYIRYKDLPLQSKTGIRREVEFVSNVYEEAGRQVIQCNIRDITERRQGEVQLRQSHDELETRVTERTAALAASNAALAASNAALAASNAELHLQKTTLEAQSEASMDGILMVSPAGQIISCNQRFIEMWDLGPVLSTSPDDKTIVGVILSKVIEPERVLEKAIYLTQNPDAISHEEIRLKDGRIFDRNSAPVKSADGVCYGRIWFHRDISERHAAEVASREASKEVERANRAKSEFLSRMSHELRTPLNGILGFGQILEMRDLGPIERESVDQILTAGRNLLDLINELLDIASVEPGNLSPSPEAVPIQGIVSEGIQLVQPLAARRNIRLVNEVGQQPGCYVLIDRQLLKQALHNMLSNAIKYNRNANTVTISSEIRSSEEAAGAPSITLREAILMGEVGIPARSGQTLRLNISDTGSDLSSADVAQLFIPFDRLAATQMPPGSTGIGLALTRQLVEVMGCKMGVDSKVGVGSVFWIDLPLTPGPLEQT